jgi:4-diphosphocytidyl-2-C-methyl-D-erythritol kinase
MLAFPNAKINLGLHILNKRNDGYHDIETVFYPVPWCDVLEIIPAEKKQTKNLNVPFKVTGMKIVGSKKKNLCIKAYQLLQEKYNLPPVQMHLHKLIPVGAGLGGGSSDASNTLLLLNKIFELGLAKEELYEYAAKLGSDCAFFIHNKPVLAKGKGDEFEETELSLKNYFLVVIVPDIHISTSEAYKNSIATSEKDSLKKIIAKPITDWKNILVNDFEKTIFKKYPLLEYLKKELYQLGTIYASMSGSGSAVYGIFKEKVNLKTKFEDCQTWGGWLD